LQREKARRRPCLLAHGGQKRKKKARYTDQHLEPAAQNGPHFPLPFQKKKRRGRKEIVVPGGRMIIGEGRRRGGIGILFEHEEEGRLLNRLYKWKEEGH